jgi:hypothetical protein
VKVWFNGKALALPAPDANGPRSLVIRLPKGTSDLLVRVAGGAPSALVTTLASDRPVEFSAEEPRGSTR